MLIELQNIKKRLSSEQRYGRLKDVNLRVARGDFLAIVGPSGSGKTTLFNILGCLDGSSAGRYLFDGEDISDFPEKKLFEIRKNKIGYIFQSFNLIPTLSVYENVELPMWGSRCKPSQIKSRIENLLQELEIAHLAGRYPRQLSGGQKQRVAIARALVRRPKVVLADEPTANLDSKTSKTMMNLLLKEAKANNTSFLIASHDVELLAQIKNVYKIVDGVIK